MTTLSRTKHAIQMALALIAAALVLAGCKQGLASETGGAAGTSSNSRPSQLCAKLGGHVERLPSSCVGGTGGGQPVAAGNSVGEWNAGQVANARIIADVGREIGVPRQAIVIAIATAMQESSLDNDNCCDHDSVGLFQQRPSQGWGSWNECHDPRHASQSFYRALLKVPGWESMSLTRAAQAVQRSAYPNAYAKHEAEAKRLAD